MRTFVCDVSPDTKWISIGSITAASTALTTAQRDIATAEAVTGVLPWQFAKGGGAVPKAVLIRFRTDGTNDASPNVIDMLDSRGDFYHRTATLTITNGQQVAGTGLLFVDTITPSNEDTLFDGEESNLTDYIAHYYVRTLGFDRLLFQATTLVSTTVYIDLCNLYE
jgi:hypothetical protein